MHTQLHRLSNGGVGNYPPNPKVVAIMMGKGLQLSDEVIQRHIANWLIPDSSEATAKGKIPVTLEMATEWELALSNGGLTEEQALDLFARRIQQRNGYLEYAHVDPVLLPHHLVGCGQHQRGSGTIDGSSCVNSNCHDRYFRNAVMWDDASPTKCRCDMPTARGIHMNGIRVVRNAELAAKDITFMRAVEAGDTSAQATIGAEKQTLRDIPQTFDLTTDTPEQLKAKWPAELPARE